MRGSQHGCNRLVNGRNAIAAIHGEDDDVSLVDSKHRLLTNRLLEDVIALRDYSTSVDNIEVLSTPFRPGIQPIPRHSGLTLNDGVPLFNDAIEQCGFADVWSANDSYKTHKDGKLRTYGVTNVTSSLCISA